MVNEVAHDRAEACDPSTLPPVVSVLIPTYNRKAWLRESIESALGQKGCVRTEIIVVDDGSTDGTDEALADLFAHPQVKYVWQRNSGRPAAARNRGLREARGDFIAFLDSDDLLHPESILRRLNVFRSFEDVALVCTDWRCFAGSPALGTKPSIVAANGFLAKVAPDLIDHHADNLFVFDRSFVYELLCTECIFTSSVMIRRSVLDIVGLFDESITIGEDLDLWLRIGTLARLAYLDEPLSFMRNHSFHITGDQKRNFLEDSRVIDVFLQRSGAIPACQRRRLHNRLAQFYAAGGMVFLQANDKSNSRKFLLSSLRWNPYSLKNFGNLLKSLL